METYKEYVERIKKSSSPTRIEFRVSVEFGRDMGGIHEIDCTSFIRNNILICFS
jgi:hypothetical protein